MDGQFKCIALHFNEMVYRNLDISRRVSSRPVLWITVIFLNEWQDFWTILMNDVITLMIIIERIECTFLALLVANAIEESARRFAMMHKKNDNDGDDGDDDHHHRQMFPLPLPSAKRFY